MTPIPLYVRQLDSEGGALAEFKVDFGAKGDGIANIEVITIPIVQACISGDSELRRPLDATPFVVVPAQKPLHCAPMNILTYNVGVLQVSASGISLLTLLSAHKSRHVSLEDFMQESPEAAPREVWDAAFMAGYQTAHIMLTGETS